jgi:hypothetical protein
MERNYAVRQQAAENAAAASERWPAESFGTTCFCFCHAVCTSRGFTHRSLAHSSGAETNLVTKDRQGSQWRRAIFRPRGLHRPSFPLRQNSRGFARLATPASATMALRLRLPELPEQTRFSHCCRHYDHFGARWPDPLSKPNKPPAPSRLAATHP